MFRMSTRRAWFLGIATGSAFSFWCNCASAQVIPDSTLPNNSIVNINGNTFNITGGTQAGGNLFHSFKDFSIRNGETAFFNNTVDIANIISRVTGGSISDINGLIRTSGTANLFLINPSGIVFGSNASLNVGGSFLASTANAIQFGNQGFFSATNPNTPPLLTVNPDALLFNQIAAASIQNNSVAPAGRAPTGLATVGLRVPDGKSLLLVGGNISMDGGRLNAFGGRVELGGLAGTGTVGLNVDGNNLSLSFPQGVQRADVSLINSAQVNVRKDNGGSIAINARNLELLGRSSLRTGIEFGLGSSDSKAGNIEVNATGAVNLKDGSLISNAMLGATGKGGDINITADSFTLTNAATVLTSTFGQGDAGSVTLQAQDRVAFINGSYIATSSVGWGNAGNVTITTAGTVIADALNTPAPNITGVYSNVEPESVGNAGNIDIKAASVFLANGAEITSKNLGQVGNAGNVSISARDTVSFDGVSIDKNSASGVFSYLGSNTVGRGGNISITTKSLSLANGSQVASSTLGQGDAGNINIDARDRVSFDGKNTGAVSRVEQSSIGKGGEISITTGSLSITNGALLSTSTFGQGDAGNIIINARDRISFDGRDSDGRSSSGAFSIVQPRAVGKGGNINITTGILSLTRDAAVDVSSFGDGTAGEIQVQADSIRLDTAGIYSETTSGDGGDITLNVQDFLLLRRGSQISTTAGTDNKGGNGGNITINAPNGLIIAVPGENSDITANAFTGSGGRVEINTSGLFGIQPSSRLTSENDITAFSESGISGEIAINRPDVEQRLEFVELPTVLADTSNIINTSCAAFADGEGNSFTVTGRGGLPPSPNEPLSTDVVWSDTRLSGIALQQRRSEGSAAKPVSKAKTEAVQIVPATGWVFDGKGHVTLISHASNANNLGATPASCQKR